LARAEEALAVHFPLRLHHRSVLLRFRFLHRYFHHHRRLDPGPDLVLEEVKVVVDLDPEVREESAGGFEDRLELVPLAAV
jgi:hypothetical protein